MSYGGNTIAGRLGEEAPIAGRCDRASGGEDPPRTEGSRRFMRPNVLLIGVDTLRADHVGCLGYMKDTTPTLDRLARGGVLCTRTMSTSGWTLPAVTSVMTSLYPEVHQTYTYKSRLGEEVTTLAEILETNGYATVGVVSNPAIHSGYGLAAGFDLYDDFTVSLDSGLDIFEAHEEALNDQQLVGTGELVTRTAARWLEQRSDEPFFMFVFYIDPHYDYIPPAPFDHMFDPSYEGNINGRDIRKEPRHSQCPPARDLQHLLALYDGELRYTDGCVAELLQTFGKSGLLDNTLVILFGDHGDEFYEHGKTAHDRTLYEEIIHVPLLFWWPDRLPAGRRVEALTSLVDIMPTVLDYLGLRPKGSLQGLSLRPLLEGKTNELHDTVWAELRTWTHLQALMGDHDKLVRNVGEDAWELYDLSHDPREQTNLYHQSSAAEVRRALKVQWDKRTQDNQNISNQLVHGTSPPEVPVSEQQLRQLKTLGYVQ